MEKRAQAISAEASSVAWEFDTNKKYTLMARLDIQLPISTMISIQETTVPAVEPSESLERDTAEDEEMESAKVEAGSSKMTVEERKAKMDQLRKRLAASSRANRQSLIEESTKLKVTARDAARLEKQRKLAETLRQKADAEERGEDIDRAKNWEYTIEENDAWEKKLARKKRRADFEFHGKFNLL
ncbi:hypothetical protein F5890DRAFT_1479500, partial [Lentinula detonsa]